jgi:hypothetical protein
MPSFVPPKKNTEFILYIGLVSQADTRLFQTNPTIAAGDFKVSIDGGALANPATLPAVTPAGSKAVKIVLSADEMNGDNIQVIGSDAAGAEWCDVEINIQTSTQQIDNLLGDAIAIGEPTGAPAASATPASKLGRLYQVLRNGLTITASAKTMKDDAGADLWSKTVTNDGTTYTESKGS